MQNCKDIDEYIKNFPKDVQEKLEKIRTTIHTAAPEATEKISYGIPTFALKGNLVHFAAYDTHYGFYPGASALVDFAADLAPYETAKGTVRFPLDKPLPLELIHKIVLYRVEQNKHKKK